MELGNLPVDIDEVINTLSDQVGKLSKDIATLRGALTASQRVIEQQKQMIESLSTSSTRDENE